MQSDNYKNTTKFCPFGAFVDMLLQANWKDRELEDGTKIKRGSFPTSQKSLEKRWNWTRGEVRAFLTTNVTTNTITIATTKLGTIITINNFEQYQNVLDERETLQPTLQPTSQPTKQPRQQPLSNKDLHEQDLEQINITLRTKTKTQFGEFVFLTEAEHEKLVAKFGAAFAQKCIDKLNNWIGSNPTADRKRNGKNAVYTFRSWVIDAVQKSEGTTARPGRVPSALIAIEETLQLAAEEA